MVKEYKPKVKKCGGHKQEYAKIYMIRDRQFMTNFISAIFLEIITHLLFDSDLK